MVPFSRFVALMLAGICLCVLGCTFPVRTGYDRKTGAYKPAPAATQTESASNAAGSATRREPQNATKQTSAGNAKRAAANKMAQENAPRPSSNSSLEQLAKSWIGTPYVFGGSSRSGTDCSGYVMQLYKEHYGISLPHNAGQMYDDSRGSSVSRGSLQEGDLVFFGSFWKIDHVGIYLKGDRFTHASSSKGVMISPMSDNYWRPKYQGARRFK
jgi:lipoprotein Spr